MKNLSEYIEYIREQAKKIQRYHTDGTNFELKLEKLFQAKNISIEEKKKILAESELSNPDVLELAKKIFILNQIYQDWANIVWEHRDKWKWFDIGETSRSVGNVPEELRIQSTAAERLPFEYTAITGQIMYDDDTPEKGEVTFACFCRDLDRKLGNGSFELITVMFTPGRVTPIGNRASVLKDSALNIWRYCPQTETPPDFDNNIDVFGDVGYRIVGAMLKLLSCSNIGVSVEKFPDKLNARRRREGKVLGYSRHIVRIDDDPSTSYNSDSLSTGKHQRFHFRRGHIRRLPNKNVWVRECYAGQKSLGVIEKDYSVEKTKVITT